jgi:hypothetical protein
MTVAQAARRVSVLRATAFRALALHQESMPSPCGGIKKLAFIMKKYVFKIKRGQGVDGESGSRPAARQAKGRSLLTGDRDSSGLRVPAAEELKTCV